MLHSYWTYLATKIRKHQISKNRSENTSIKYQETDQKTPASNIKKRIGKHQHQISRNGSENTSIKYQEMYRKTPASKQISRNGSENTSIKYQEMDQKTLASNIKK